MGSYRLEKADTSILFMWLMDTSDLWRIDAHAACLSDGSEFWRCQLSGVEKDGPDPQSDAVRDGQTGSALPSDTLLLLSRLVWRQTGIGPTPFYANTI
jgi:hypothetical protein